MTLAEPTDYRRLAQANQIANCLSETERNILRMAAAGKAHGSIASLYGFRNADAVKRALEQIARKMEAGPRAEQAPARTTTVTAAVGT